MAPPDAGMTTVWHGTSRLCGEIIWRDQEFHYPLYVSTIKDYARSHAIAAAACDLDRGGDKRYVLFEFNVPQEALVKDPDGNPGSYVFYACPPGGMDVKRIDGDARAKLSASWFVNIMKLKGAARSLQPIRDAELDLEDAEIGEAA